MEKSRVLLGLLFIVWVKFFCFPTAFKVANLICFQVPALVKCQDTNWYVSEDGELITDPPSPPKPDVASMTTSDKTCLKLKTIVYYENYFRDGWVGAGNDPIARYILISY